MALADQVSGVVDVLIDLSAVRTNPTGLDKYKLNFNQVFANTETVADGTAGRLRVLFNEVITVTTTSTVLSLADDADPMNALGSNVPNADPEGMGVKILALKNLSASDGSGQQIYVMFNDAAQNGLTGPLVTYSSLAVPPDDSGVAVAPGGLVLFVSPQGHAAINDGADDEIAVKVAASTAQLQILYAGA